MSRSLRPLAPLALIAALFLSVDKAAAEQKVTLSLSGVPGLMDMPSGEVSPDGAFSMVSSRFGPIGRTTLSFQLAPRIGASFRYTSIREWGDVFDIEQRLYKTYFDRAFDLRYLVLEEGKYRPAVTVGFQDVIGTGLMSGEYIAATKNIGSKLKVTAGVGWGRYGSFGSIAAPFGARPVVDFGQGGAPRLGQWFKGDMAPFAGVEWQMTDKIGFKAEYSSDNYDLEAGNKGTFARKSPFNFGIEYQLLEYLNVGAYYMYGSEVGIAGKVILNPRVRPSGLSGPGPQPVLDRPAATGWSAEWVNDSASKTALRDALQKKLRPEGIIIESLSAQATSVEVRIRNTQLDNNAQALGRIARALANTMPPSVETFNIVPVSQGVPLSRVIVQRRDLERFEFASGQDAALRDRVAIEAFSGKMAPDTLMGAGLYPKLTWGVRPYARVSAFDPENPYRYDLGVRLQGRYDIAPGLVFSGSLSKSVVGNIDESNRKSNSIIQHVRSDGNLYDKFGDPTIDTLTFAWYGKPAENLYSRVSIGYLERMFGGVSAELLWKRADSPLALSAEVNYVKQRDFDQLLGFQSYSVATGHVSGYYAFGNGYLAQVDVGRYLAGDFGGTLTFEREFGNGWKIGAFATLTDVPFEDFGEGSFDKGIKIEIPLAWALGKPTRKTAKSILRPLSRDGGARLDVEGRLYESVREYHTDRLDAEWGRFWR